MGLTLLRCSTADAALTALQNPGARLIGGGTFLVRMTNTGDASIDEFVRLDLPEIRAIEISGATARLGSAVTMSQIIRHPALDWLVPAARSIGGPAIRNVATVGGNLFAASPYGDLATALLALDAQVHLYTPLGERKLGIDQFFAQRSVELHRSIVLDVTFDLPTPGTFLYKKVRRTQPKGLSILTISATIVERNTIITHARLAYGAMAATPVRAYASEHALAGRQRTHDGVSSALAVATQGTTPSDDPISSAWYKTAVLPVHLRRLLLGDGTEA
jgi:CO/xanthine dehydrogenase FAD-binding subunit